jgi:uncharacterized protein
MTIIRGLNLEQARQYARSRLEKELSPGFYYHSLRHTVEDIVPAAERLAQGEGAQGEPLDLLLTAAWFHDLGFVEARAGHEGVAVRLAAEVLPGYGYTPAHVETIQGIILATVIPQSPTTLLQQILADADLDVLGRDDFMACNHNLRRELAFFGQVVSDQQWYAGQLRFVESHAYFTATARTLRNAGQEKNVGELKRKLDESS